MSAYSSVSILDLTWGHSKFLHFEAICCIEIKDDANAANAATRAAMIGGSMVVIGC